MLPDACFVTAIRDPISHFLSAYNEIEYRNLQWYNDWTNTTSKTKINNASHSVRYGDFPKASKERFTQFVINIVDGRRTEKDMTKYPSDMWHVYPQS